eukprot:3457332-Rhodomonas_salina.2
MMIASSSNKQHWHDIMIVSVSPARTDDEEGDEPPRGVRRNLLRAPSPATVTSTASGTSHLYPGRVT